MPNKVRFDEPTIIALYQEYESGKTLKELAIELSCDRETLSRSFKRFGLSLRLKGLEYFSSKLSAWAKSQNENCLIWDRARNFQDGYGIVYKNTGTDFVPLSVHRLALEWKLGRNIRAGLYALHSCDNPPCFNPLHLSEGTSADNMQDMTQKGRASNQFTKPRGALTA